MKIKLISVALSLPIIMGVCGCKSQGDDTSSDTQVIEAETIIVDQDGNEITSSSDDTVTFDDNNSSVNSTPDEKDDNDTSSDNTSSGNNSTTDSNNAYIDYNTVVEVDICDDIVRGYLDTTTVNNQYFWLSTYQTTKAYYQNITLDWEIGRPPYTIYMSENADFSNSIITQTNSSEIKNAICIPGKTYYWKVVGYNSDKILGGGRIKIKDAPVRWIKIDGISNVRDMGGWTTTSGQKVKYEMLYRGAQLNAKQKDGTIVQNLKSTGLETFNKLGIKTEFDLRIDRDVGAPAEGTNLNYVFIANHTAYHNIFSRSTKETIVSNYKEIFKVLSDKNNYPIYTHCQGGADRTGTYAFLLNGLLGVSYEDLTRDFELTSFGGNKCWRSEGKGGTFGPNDTSYKTETGQTIAWDELYKGMMEYGAENGCTTLQQSIEHWLINYVGVPKSQIDSFKSIMLE